LLEQATDEPIRLPRRVEGAIHGTIRAEPGQERIGAATNGREFTSNQDPLVGQHHEGVHRSIRSRPEPKGRIKQADLPKDLGRGQQQEHPSELACCNSRRANSQVPYHCFCERVHRNAVVFAQRPALTRAGPLMPNV
jgi:hypothetical protein